MVCDVCGKKREEWGGGLAASFMVRDKEIYQCPECTLKRFLEIANENKEKWGEYSDPKQREEINQTED